MRHSLSILLGLAFLAVVPGCLHPCCDVGRRCGTGGCMPDSCESETVLCAPRGPDAECHGFKPTTWQPWPCDEGYTTGTYHPPIYSPTPAAEPDVFPDAPPAPKQVRKPSHVRKTSVIRKVTPQPRPMRVHPASAIERVVHEEAAESPAAEPVKQALAVEPVRAAKPVKPAPYDPFDEFVPSYESGPFSDTNKAPPVRVDAELQQAAWVVPAAETKSPVAAKPIAKPQAPAAPAERRTLSRATSDRSDDVQHEGDDAPPVLPASCRRESPAPAKSAVTKPTTEVKGPAASVPSMSLEDDSDDPAPSYRGR